MHFKRKFHNQILPRVHNAFSINVISNLKRSPVKIKKKLKKEKQNTSTGNYNVTSSNCNKLHRWNAASASTVKISIHRIKKKIIWICGEKMESYNIADRYFGAVTVAGTWTCAAATWNSDPLCCKIRWMCACEILCVNSDFNLVDMMAFN